MASTKGGLMADIKQNNTPAAVTGFGALLREPAVHNRFTKMFQDPKKADCFLASALTLYNSDKNLQRCESKTILSALCIAASLDLPINKSLGMAYVIPYGSKAEFQLGYQGLITLAMRSGVMKSIIATEVYEGEIEDFNRFTETMVTGTKKSDTVVGFYASFELINGFTKKTYWTVEEVREHAKKFSKTYSQTNGVWSTNFNAMGCKTVLKSILKYAPKSTQMQDALIGDAGGKAEVTEEGEVTIIDADVESTTATVVESEASGSFEPVPEEAKPEPKAKAKPDPKEEVKPAAEPVEEKGKVEDDEDLEL